jgi:hypothetical protein
MNELNRGFNLNMADNQEEQNEVIEEVQNEETEVIDEISEETAPAGEVENQESEEQSEDEIVVSIGEESPSEEDEVKAAPDWVRNLRKENREKERRIKELESKLNAPKEADKPLQLGAKPSLDQFDYDAEKYEAALEVWYETKRMIEHKEAETKAVAEKQQQQWNETLKAYETKKTQLKVKDFADAENVVTDTLDETKQGIILHAAKDPALLVYALGKNPKKVRELASISDPVKFAYMIGGLEKELKVTNRKAPPPPPEKRIKGTAPLSGTVDSTLERLREEAERTGDMTKVLAYKRQLRNKS